jgi:hypothetical protein
MRLLLTLTATVAAALGLVAAAPAAAPDHETFSSPYSYTDTDTCGFPITVAGVFTNLVIDFSVATGTGTLELHQSNVATLTANGVTLQENDRYTILVDIVDGVPTTSKYVGALNSIVGLGGPIFLRTGQAVYQIVFDPDLGYYVDGSLVTRHGLRANFPTDTFCAAFA